MLPQHETCSKLSSRVLGADALQYGDKKIGVQFGEEKKGEGLNNTDHPLCNTDNSKKPSPFFQALPRGTFNPNRSDIGTNE